MTAPTYIVSEKSYVKVQADSLAYQSNIYKTACSFMVRRTGGPLMWGITCLSTISSGNNNRAISSICGSTGSCSQSYTSMPWVV